MNRRHFLGAAAAATMLSGGLSSLKGAGHDQVLAKVQPIIEALEKEYGKNLSLSPEEAKFVSMLVRSGNYKQLLEIGTSRGYTTLWLGRALASTNGKAKSLDILPERTQEAKENLSKAGIENRVEFQTGDAHKLLATFKEKFDFVLLDADKKGNLDYLEKLEAGLLEDKAMIVAHGAKTMQKEMKPFIDAFATRKNWDSMTVQIVPEETFFIAFRG